jgi:hypothetical protein
MASPEYDHGPFSRGLAEGGGESANPQAASAVRPAMAMNLIPDPSA